MPPERSPASILLDDEAWAENSVPSDEAAPPVTEPGQPDEEGEEVPAGPESTPDEDEDERIDEPPEREDEDEGEDSEEGDGFEADEEESGDEVVTADPEVKAFLTKYQNDVPKALKGAAELSRLVGRQARDLTALQETVGQLQSALVEAQTVGAGLGAPLNEQQREWVDGAAQSVNPAAFAKQAVDQGEFELARAVCREWALTNPYEALRVGQWVDASEVQLYQAAQQVPPVTTDQVIAALDEAMPEMRAYYAQMTDVVRQLGDSHPLVAESRSADPQEAMRGMIGLYEIARASTATVEDAQADLKKQRRKQADDERAKGLVSSATNSPSQAETPRSRLLMPGLTQEALDTEFAAQTGR